MILSHSNLLCFRAQVSAAQLISGVFYISTYEGVRHILAERGLVSDSRIRGMIGGAAASLVGQSIVVPFDVISQHLMMLGHIRGKSSSFIMFFILP